MQLVSRLFNVMDTDHIDSAVQGLLFSGNIVWKKAAKQTTGCKSA